MEEGVPHSSDCPHLSEQSQVINCFHYISNVQESISAKTPPIRRLYTTLVHQTSREQDTWKMYCCGGASNERWNTFLLLSENELVKCFM
jgi:hypothetical protein